MPSRMLTLLLTATLITSTSSSATAQQTSTTSTGKATCEVCIPPKYKAACDAEKRARKTCANLLESEQRTSAAIELGLNSAREAQALQAARIAALEAELERQPDPILVGGLGAVLGAGVVALVWWLAVR